MQVSRGESSQQWGCLMHQTGTRTLFLQPGQIYIYIKHQKNNYEKSTPNAKLSFLKSLRSV
jgi:hypothetical protein